MPESPTAQMEFDNFLLAIKSNVPLAGFVKPNLLEHEVYVIVLASVPPPRLSLARHYFYNPNDPLEEWPSVLVFTDEEETKSYTKKEKDLFDYRKMALSDIMKVTFNASRGTCGVMFRIGDDDTHLDPEQVFSFNTYAQLGGVTLIADSHTLNLEKIGDPILTAEQLEKLDKVIEGSPFVNSYLIWRSEIEGIDTTVIEIEFKEGITEEQAVPEHQKLLEQTQAIVSDVTLIAVPFRSQLQRPAQENLGLEN